jgi:hypothetical protein
VTLGPSFNGQVSRLGSLEDPIDWPQLELDGLFALEAGAERILPVWHGVTADDVRRYSPILSERLAVSSGKGVDHVAQEIVRTVTNPR